MDDRPALSAWFPSPGRDAWEPLARKALKGKDPARLLRQLLDGPTVAPLYTAPAGSPLSPGLARAGAWELRALHLAATTAAEATDLAEAAAQDVARGVDSLLLSNPSGAPFTATTLGPVAAVRGGAGLVLDCGTDGAGALAALQDVDATDGAALLVDPLGELARRGGDPDALDADWDALAALITGAPAGMRVVSLSTLVADEAGAESATGLGWLLASGAALLRAMDDRGIAPAAVCDRLQLQLGVGRDQLVGLSRLRALRLLWARLLGACGVAPAASRVPVHAVQLARDLSRRDPWTNLLRSTMAGFVGAVGGADAVTVLPFDHALGRPDALGLRLATNTQLLLAQESHLGATVDPCHGAWAFEGLTEAQCAAAWGAFQELETAGGAAAVLRSGALAARVAGEQARRRQRIGARKDVMVGVSEFADLAAAPLSRAPAPALALAPDGPVAPLLAQRDAAPWEALQDAGLARGATVFLACWGPLRTHKARADWIANLVQAGGLVAVHGPADTDPDGILAAFRASGAAAAVVCAPDAEAAAAVDALVPGLEAAGARWIGVAGRALADSALPQLYLGGDALDQMTALHSALGVCR